MNKQRRQRLQEALDIITEVKDEEQQALDNLPEPFQTGEQGEAMETIIESLDNAASDIEEIVNG